MPQSSQKTSIYKVHNRQHDPGPLALMCYRVVSGFSNIMKLPKALW